MDYTKLFAENEISQERASDYVHVPSWMEQGITLGEIAEWFESPYDCAAPLFSDNTMAQQGSIVIQYLKNAWGDRALDVPAASRESWQSMCEHWMRFAYELWCEDNCDKIWKELVKQWTQERELEIARCYHA